MNNNQFLVLIAIIFFMFGAVCNLLVVGFNGGKMPVKWDVKYITDKHFSYTDGSTVILEELSDKYDVFNYTLSMGDIIMILSLLILTSIVINGIYLKFKSKKN